MARARNRLLVGLLIFIAVAAAFLVWWRGAGPTPPERGGSLAASLRSEPTNYLRLVEQTAAADLVSLLLDARLVRVNRLTDTVEPALAESWTQSADGLTYSLVLREDVRFSDGAPFTSADVEFTARVLYDPRVNSGLARALMVDGQPVRVQAAGTHSVTVTLPSRFAPGIRLLDSLPILPRHRLEPAFLEGKLSDVWRAGAAPETVVGLGPFTLVEHLTGQRMVFARNPQYYRLDDDGVRLPYLDRLTVVIVPDQNTEALRLEAGEIDLMSNADIRPDDYAAFKRASDAGRLRLVDVGVGLDPNVLWFNLSSTLRPEAAWLRERAFRQAVSHAVNRQALVDTVYLGAAVPVFGPVTPGNRTWYSPSVPEQPHDPAKARELLQTIGLVDRNGDGVLDDASGAPVRFSILTQKGHTIRERSVAVIQEHLRQVGIMTDVATMEQGAIAQRWMQGQYDSIYFGVQSSSTDPALYQEFWLSSGAFHFWNPRQPSPSTEWERRIDELMREQVAADTLAERQRIFAEVQRIFGHELPAIYFAAPRVIVALSHRVRNAKPVVSSPQILWSAETLAVAR